MTEVTTIYLVYRIVHWYTETDRELECAFRTEERAKEYVEQNGPHCVIEEKILF